MYKNFERYGRQTMLPRIGVEGQRRLANSRVLIVGVGGLGAPVATYLAGAGVGTIGLCDHDRVSLTNLQRQVLYTEAEIGLSKIDCAARRLSSQNSLLHFELHPQGLSATNAAELIDSYDLVLDCTDNFGTRFIIDDACIRCNKPWIHGAIGEFNGQVTLLNGPRAGVRYGDLYPDREALCAQPRTVAGVLGAVPGVIGSIQACAGIEFLACGECSLDGRLLAADLLNFQFETIDLI